MIRFLSFCVCLLVFNISAYAAKIRVDISGTITVVSGSDNAGNAIAMDAIKADNAFTHRLIFNETTNPDDSGDYPNAITGFSTQVGSFSFAQTRAIGSSFGNQFQTRHGNNSGNRNDFNQTSGTIAGLSLNNFYHLMYNTGADVTLNNALTRDRLPRTLIPVISHTLSIRGTQQYRKFSSYWYT